MPRDEKTYRAIRREAHKDIVRLLNGDNEDVSDISMDDVEEFESYTPLSNGRDDEQVSEGPSNETENESTRLLAIDMPSTMGETCASTEAVDSDSLVEEDLYDWECFIEDIEEDQENVASTSADCDSVEDHFLDLSELLKELHEEESPSDSESVQYFLQKDLAQWAVQHNITHRALDDLLDVVRKSCDPSLPKNAKTLLKTPRNNAKNIKVCAGGYMWYYGILKSLEKKLQEDSSFIIEDTITIDAHVDGISPYKSVRKSLVPITCCIADESNPFIVAVWCGRSKDPTDVDEFLQDFISEAKVLMSGFTWRDKQLKLTIRRIIADASARAWLKKVNQHGSKICCERCTIKAEWKNRRMTYDVSKIGELRSDESFAAQVQQKYHYGTSPLLELGIGMISQIPLDGMHLLYLGVMKRLLAMLLRPKASQQKLTAVKTKELSDMLVSLIPYFPSEFGRKPRPLLEWKLYKAKELRRLLFYDGLLLFKKVNTPVFQNFLLLHCASRILNDEDLKQYNSDADFLLKEFVKSAGSVALYGQTFNVYNVHHLVHLAVDCKCHGILDDFSAFKFKNYLGSLKDILRAPGRTLVQIAARTIEKAQMLTVKKQSAPSFNLSQQHYKGPLHNLQGNQYQKLETSDGTVFRTSFNDACFQVKDGPIVVIKNIVKEGNKTFLVGQAFEKMESYFVYPFASSKLGIYEVCNLGDINSWKIELIHRKYVLLPICPQEYSKRSEHFKRFLAIPMMKNER